MKRILAAITFAVLSMGYELHAAESKTTLTKKEVKALVTSAKTREDHLKLANYYSQMAVRYLGQSREHEEMKAWYEKTGVYHSSKLKASTIDHCDYFVRTFRESALKMKEMAAMHEEMAREASEK